MNVTDLEIYLWTLTEYHGLKVSSLALYSGRSGYKSHTTGFSWFIESLKVN